jgi:ferritin-like metal-binding protein YciE
MPAKEKNLHELLLEQLKDIYSAEKQVLRALPKMIKKVSNESLRTAFEEHLSQTEEQVQRLDQVGEILGKKLTGKKCVGMEGLVEEGNEVMEEFPKGGVLDAALIAAAQKVEHYEIGSYGTCAKYAELLGMDDVKDLLGETLNEEEKTDKKLSAIAEDVNRQAINGSGEEEEE